MFSIRKQRFARDVFKDKNGASVVEFAIVLLPLIYILTGIINFGYALYAYNSINNAAIDAARSYTHGALTKSEAQSLARSETAQFGGWFSFVYIYDSPSNTSEINIWVSSDAFSIIDIPYASLEYYTPFVHFTHTTPVYNLEPFSYN